MSISSINTETPNQIKRHNLDQHTAKGKVATQADRILVAIAQAVEPLTRSQIAKQLGMPVGSVCGRVHTLFSNHLVDIVGTVTCPVTESTAHAVECTDLGKAAAVAAAIRVKFSDKAKVA